MGCVREIIEKSTYPIQGNAIKSLILIKTKSFNINYFETEKEIVKSSSNFLLFIFFCIEYYLRNKYFFNKKFKDFYLCHSI